VYNHLLYSKMIDSAQHSYAGGIDVHSVSYRPICSHTVLASSFQYHLLRFKFGYRPSLHAYRVSCRREIIRFSDPLFQTDNYLGQSNSILGRYSIGMNNKSPRDILRFPFSASAVELTSNGNQCGEFGVIDGLGRIN
jgi:hypothetical protein